MDISQLKAFIAVAHSHNLTQASEKLFLSQPAVSAQIKSLEAHIGTTLFIRNSNGMTLTRAGEVLLPEAEALIQQKHRLEMFAQTLSEQYVHHIQVGLIHPVQPHLVTQLTDGILQKNPTTQLHIQYGMSGEILSRIVAKKLHGGFFLGHINQRNLQILPLGDIAYSLICHEKYYDDIVANLPKSLNDYTWVEMSGISGSHKNLQQFWHRHKLRPKKQIICDYPRTIIDLVCNGVGLAIVPKYQAEGAIQQNRSIAILQQFEQNLPLSFIYLDEFGEDPMLQFLREVVSEVWEIRK